jgi:hypothetical protein
MKCPNCQATGRISNPPKTERSNWSFEECPMCDGTGEVNYIRTEYPPPPKKCSHCKGSGKAIKKVPDETFISGKAKTFKNVEVKCDFCDGRGHKIGDGIKTFYESPFGTKSHMTDWRPYHQSTEGCLVFLIFGLAIGVGFILIVI